MVMDGVTPFLPQEIIHNILKRLPVKSIIRFQCVCKDWKNLFNTPSFIAEHLHNSIQNPYLLFQQNHRRGDPFHLNLLDCKMQALELLNVPMVDPSFFVRIIGSCNGLLCVEINIQGIYAPSLLLWNPAIRQTRQVATIDDFEGDCYSGFGFSPVVNDYKIVRTYAEFNEEVDRVEVYSLSTGSWKEIEIENLEGIKLFPKPVTANGVMFWYGSKLDVEEEDDLIVSFDIAMEVFEFVPVPAIDVLDSFAIYELHVYENKLAIISNTWKGDFELLFYLWVMEEGIGAFEERWSWTKKNTISTIPGMWIPFGIWRNEIVCNIDEIPGLIGETECDAENGMITVFSMFNPHTNKSKNFGTCRCGNKFSVIFNFAESLVPVCSIHIEEPSS